MISKKIGNLEIDPFENTKDVEITKHYNDSVKSQITLRGVEEIQDLIHVLKQVEYEFTKANGRHLPG